MPRIELAHLLGLARPRARPRAQAAQPKPTPAPAQPRRPDPSPLRPAARSRRSTDYDFRHLVGLAPTMEAESPTEPQSFKPSKSWPAAFRRLQNPLPKPASDAAGRAWDRAFARVKTFAGAR